MSGVELHELDLLDVAARICEREISAREATRALLERIEKLEPYLHAYITLTPGRALEQARAIDVAIKRGASPGPLAGVPLALEDIFDIVSHARSIYRVIRASCCLAASTPKACRSPFNTSVVTSRNRV